MSLKYEKIFLLMWIWLTACTKGNNQQQEKLQIPIPEVEKEPSAFLYQDQASIDYKEDSLEPFPFTPYAISPGSKTVFVYFYQKQVQPGVFDAQYSERVMFEVDSKPDSFYYQNKDMLHLRCSDIWASAWGESDSSAFYLERGYIKGKKLTPDRWKIDLRLVSYDNWSEKDRVTEIHREFIKLK